MTSPAGVDTPMDWLPLPHLLAYYFFFFMIGWTDRKRGLHDMIAGTLVHKANSPELVRNNAEIFS